MRTNILLFVTLSLVCLAVAIPNRHKNSDVRDAREASVVVDPKSGKLSLKDGIDKNAVAYGSFEDTMDSDGWGILDIKTNAKFDGVTQYKAAGFLEGALTANRIHQHTLNINSIFFKHSPPSTSLLAFVEEQDLWVRSKISGDVSKLSNYWQQVAFINAQLDGLYQGYNENSADNKKLSFWSFQMLNLVGDLLDLITAVDTNKAPKWDSMTPEERKLTLAQMGHCSGFIKVLGDYSDLFAGHSSWFSFGSMNRIYKHYNFDVSFAAAKRVSFSSYPGFLESLDDFYIMDSGLVMVQTTNSILDVAIYKDVKPQSLWAWQRVRLANAMASTGKEWSELVALHNSGTYNNQYMVVDYKLFKPGKELPANLLWVVEQIPGLVEAADVTQQLERGYWPSYNVPYFERVYNLSGYPTFVQKYGTDYSYQLAPRAKIFRRDQAKVTDFDSFKAFLRYNNYKEDPYSNGNPGDAICSRFDLSTTRPAPSGCYDTKATSYLRQSKLVADALNGPTTSHGIPPFQWNPTWTNSTDHYGMPNVFNFNFIQVQPKNF